MDIPVINLKATGENINRMRLEAGIAVKDIQQACGFTDRIFRRLITCLS